ncbi:hypothetical protein D9M73_243370 [compost metagenome]
MHCFRRINPRVININNNIELSEFIHNIDDFSVTQIRAVFFERQPHDQDASTVNMNFTFQHRLDKLRDYIGSHAVIQTTTR